MAMIPNLLVGRYLTKLADFVEGEICKMLGVKEEIKRFKRRLERLSPYLRDAEQKRHQDARVNAWLRDLKEIIYDAEDIIELCTLQGGGKLLSVQPSSSSSSPVSSPFSLLASCFSCTKSRHEIAKSFERLNDRLKEIKDDGEITASLVPLTSCQWPQDHQTRSRPTTSLEVKADIVGAEIEDAAQTLIGMILKHEKQNGVFGIIGMGGIGKTTLAHKIFHDKRIENSFPTRIWIHVPSNHTEVELLKQILKQAKGSDDGAESMEELESKLVGALVNRFFLVLDDVWSANAWMDVLRNPILNAESSCGIILVTSRHEKVLKEMRASHIHRVQRMKEDIGLELFRKVVFEDEENENLELDEVAAEIVRKCNGLPLAIKVIAGVLISKKRTRREWERVLESDLWRMRGIEDELPRALYLSYEDLPSVLKQCFLCCASYIDVWHSSDLVRLWIAEGLIDVPKSELMEELAEDYYRELVMRNLLQLDPRSADETRYSMHDLLQALGTNLIGEEALTMSDGRVADTYPDPLTKIRRLWMSSKGDALRLPGVVLEQKSLRVLRLSGSSGTKTIEDETALPALRNLRVLDACETQIERLPDFVFMNLLLLRYLDLDRTKVREIPESIRCLANLQTLNIAGCKSLHILPKAVTSLGMLRCLRVEGTPLTHLPGGMGRLTNLNHIEGFVVGHGGEPSDGCDLEELQSLSKLRFLSVCKLERAAAGASPVLANKPLLRHLSLSWTNREQGDDGEKAAAEEETCSALLPPSSLEDLRLHNFPGRRFPNWMMSTSAGSSFPHLEFLKLCDFPCCTELPPLGQLPRLRFLEIKGASAVRKVGPELLGAGFPQAVAFPRLEFLQFKDMPNWEEWTLYAASEEVGEKERSLKLFPRMEECTFTGCPKLRGLPDSIYCAARLKNVFVSTRDQLSEIEFTRQETLEIDDCPHVILLLDSTELPQWLLDHRNRKRFEKNSQPSRPIKNFYLKSW